jgi:CRP/FNR family transcriptional regulator, cyclic AMP receptor protein
MWPSQGSAINVLEADPDLAMGLSAVDTAAATRELVAPCVSLGWKTNGYGWGPPDPRGHFGLLVVAGLLLREVRLLGTSSAELLGHGDVLRPWDADGEFDLPVPADVRWTALQPTAVAVLDPDFLRRAAAWPDVLSNLARRAVVRAKSMALNDAITNLKQVELRLLVLFWHLADRWGRVGVRTIAVPLPLTHETLAKLVGAARPSVTTALGALAERELLYRDDDTWQLSRDAEKAFGDAGDAYPKLAAATDRAADGRSQAG